MKHGVCVFLLSFCVLSLATASDLNMEGEVSYEISGSYVKLSADRIINHSDSGTGGSMKWTLWATEEPYDGGSINGYNLGEYTFAIILRPGATIEDYSIQTLYDAPPDGTYHITLTLSEWNLSEYVIRDYRIFDETQRFGSGGGDSTTTKHVLGIPYMNDLGGGWYATRLLGNIVEVDNGWAFSDWLGFIYPNVTGDNTWFYSVEWEWCYIVNDAEADSDWWCWAFSYEDWLWTTSGYYPSVYRNNIGSWCYWDSARLAFYNNDTSSWVGNGDNTDDGNDNGSDDDDDFIGITEAFIVDVTFTRTDMTNDGWNGARQRITSILNSGGFTDYYEYSYTSSEAVFRFETRYHEIAEAWRDGLQSLEGPYDGFNISVTTENF